MAARNSIRAPRARSVKPFHKSPKAGPPSPVDFGTLIYQLVEAIALVATACRAMEGVEDETGNVSVVNVSDEILALRHGVAALRRACEALELGVQQVRP